MQQHRRLPSALLAVVALAGTACTATSFESAAAPHVRAAEPAVAPAEAIAGETGPVTTPPAPRSATVPPTTVPPTTVLPTTVLPTTVPPETVPPETVPPTTVPPSTSTSAPDVRPVVTIAPVVALDACGPVAAIPESAAGLMSIDLDATGDGTADDTAISYLAGDTGEWKLRLVTAGGVVSEQAVAGVSPGFVEVLGAVEFGSTGADSFLATVGSTPSALRIGLFGADEAGCLVRHGGDSLEFAVGGSIGGFSGVRCGSWDGGHSIESLGAGQVGPGAYNVYGTSVHLGADGEVFAESGTHLFGVTVDEAESIASIDCPGFE